MTVPTIESSSTVDDASKSARVVDHLREFIVAKGLRSGDRLPAERELSQQLGLTRGDVRRGIGYLAALGVLEVRHGVGAFLADTTAGLGIASMELLRSIGGFETSQMFEARRALESELVALAAEHCREDQFTPMAEELAEMFATVEDAGEFLIHDIRFHRAIARASNNPILTAFMEAISGALYEERQRVAGTRENRTKALELHREIYQAIRSHDPEAARRAMRSHLRLAEVRSSVSQD
jgi:GntR family transcriptional repressor for pyruvate dehydrogenase complex